MTVRLSTINLSVGGVRAFYTIFSVGVFFEASSHETGLLGFKDECLEDGCSQTSSIS